MWSTDSRLLASGYRSGLSIGNCCGSHGPMFGSTDSRLLASGCRRGVDLQCIGFFSESPLSSRDHLNK